MHFKCPHCNTLLRSDEATEGQEVECPACGQTFAVQKDDGRPDTAKGADSETSATGTARSSEGEPMCATNEQSRLALLRGRTKNLLRIAKTAISRAYDHARILFRRLPERARWAVLAAFVLLLGIAVVSGRSSEKNVAARERQEAAGAGVSPAESTASPRKPLSEAAKRQMTIAFVAPTTSSIMQKRIADCVHSEMEKKARLRRKAFTADEKKEAQELIDFTYAGMMVAIWPNIDLSDCPQEFRDGWKQAVDHFSKNSAARFSVDIKKLLEAAGTVDLEWWRMTKEDIRRKSGSYPNYRSDEELIAEMSKRLLLSIRDVANESDFRDIVASSVTPDIVDAAHKAMCAAGDAINASSAEKSKCRKSSGNGSATPEELCEEFASGGSHFVRKNATTVWWDVGGETPRFTCEVSFLPGGKARLTQDNTFYAYEEKNRSTSPQVLARRLQAAYNRYQGGSSEIRNVKAVATSDGRLLFSGEISVERGNVSKQIGKVFDALNEARLASRWN